MTAATTARHRVTARFAACALGLALGTAATAAYADGVDPEALERALERALRTAVGPGDPMSPATGLPLRARSIGGVDLIRGREKSTVDLLMVTGLAPLPTLAWATLQPEPRLFAYTSDDRVVIASSGWAGIEAKLERRQQRAIAQQVARMTEELGMALEGRLLIDNARGPQGIVDVVVEGGTIVAVEPDPGASRQPRRLDWIVDAGGRAIAVAPDLGSGPWASLAGLASLPAQAPGTVDEGLPATLLVLQDDDASQGAGDPAGGARDVVFALRDGVAFDPSRIRARLGMPPGAGMLRPVAPEPPKSRIRTDGTREMSEFIH